jgi:hypothetical protein
MLKRRKSDARAAAEAVAVIVAGTELASTMESVVTALRSGWGTVGRRGVWGVGRGGKRARGR